MKSASFIYFIAPVDGPGRIKIGFSREPERRLADLLAHSPYKLAVAASLPGTKRDEYFIHWRFSASHVHHEWFTAAPDITDAITFIRQFGELPPHLMRDKASAKDEAEYCKWSSLKGHRGPAYLAFIASQQASA